MGVTTAVAELFPRGVLIIAPFRVARGAASRSARDGKKASPLNLGPTEDEMSRRENTICPARTEIVPFVRLVGLRRLAVVARGTRWEVNTTRLGCAARISKSTGIGSTADSLNILCR